MSDDQSRGRRSKRDPRDSPRGSSRDGRGDRDRGNYQSGSTMPSFKRQLSSLDSPPAKLTKTIDEDESKSFGLEGPSTSRAAIAAATATRKVSEQSFTPARTKPDDNKRRTARHRYEIVQSRPQDLETKQGVGGDLVDLTANYFNLTTKPKFNFYQYHITFTPEIENKRFRCGLLSNHGAAFGGYIFDGTKLFCTRQLESSTINFEATSSKTGEKYDMKVKFVGIIEMTDWQSLQILNLILRRAMEGLRLELVGRNFYDPNDKIEMRDYNIQLWPGYQTSIRQHERNILLCAEITYKVMRTETVYDILKKCYSAGSDYQENFKRQVLGTTVLTLYNNKTYKIIEIDFNKTPKSTFNMKDKQVSFIDYYRQKYNERITDPNQPLLISKVKGATFQGGDKNDVVMLVPQLCKATGLTDAMRSDFRLMKAMADHTRVNPDRRIERLIQFKNRLSRTQASRDKLAEWNLTLSDTLVQVQGRNIASKQKIIFHNNSKVDIDQDADWSISFRNNQLFTTPSRGIVRWTAIAPRSMGRELNTFISVLTKAGSGMSMQFSRPQECLLSDDRNFSYIRAIDDCCKQDQQFVLCLVPNNNAERYNSIKKKCCLERAIPSQVITKRLVNNQKGLMSIATKVAIQINCKLGYTPWMIDIPVAEIMFVGYDMAKSTRDRSKAYCSLVASMDLQVNSTFYSTVAECNAHDVLANNISVMITKALRQYKREHNDKLPQRIMFYRDGVGEGLVEQILEYEVKDLVQKLEQLYKTADAKPPKLAYIIVNKNINTRFFVRGKNPRPGTIVDDVVTLPERYDFYLVSQSVRQGTVSPTSYNVIYSNIRLKPEHIQALTYKMTHLYYNWSGTTRVPAVCQYAKKLSTLVGTSLFNSPSGSLDKKLYYL